MCEAKAACSMAIRDAKTWRVSQAELLQRQHAKSCKTWRSKSSKMKADAKLTSSPLARLPYTPAWQSSKACWWLLTKFYRGRPPNPTYSPYHQEPPQQRNSLLQQLLPAPVPKQSPKPKRQHPSPDPVDTMPLAKTTSKTAPEEPPNSKWWEVPPCNWALKWSHSEVFSQDSDLVKEAREEYFSKHSYNFTTEGTCNITEIFRQMAKSAKLLGTSIYEIEALWTGLDELRQANYALVPPSESPKVMGLVGIHDPDALCNFNSMTHCPWCGKEGQNEGTVVNHLWTVHYRLGLVCNKCNNCPSMSLDTLHCHGQQDCQQPGEKVPDELVLSE